MSQASRSSELAGRTYRLDTDHHLLEMMSGALKHLNREISVELHADSILLRGHVTSWSEKQLAQETIRRMSGRRMISNELDVASS